MRTITALLLFLAVGLAPGAVAAQGRSGRGTQGPQGVPPGQLPPPGLCRVWFDGVPPGRQPGPTTCAEARRIASQTRSARVIYGATAPARTAGRGLPTPIPADGRGDPRKRGIVTDVRNRTALPLAFDQGYEDGFDQGWDDARDGDRYNAVNHNRYRDANRGYSSRLGSRVLYAQSYREGFRAGYADAYVDVTDARQTPSGKRGPVQDSRSSKGGFWSWLLDLR